MKTATNSSAKTAISILNIPADFSSNKELEDKQIEIMQALLMLCDKYENAE